MFLKRTLPILACVIIGIGFTIHFYIPHKAAADIFDEVKIWIQIIASVAFFLGFLMVAVNHSGKIIKQKAGWGYSTFVILGLGISCGIGLATLGESTDKLGNPTAWHWFYMKMYNPLSGTVFAILGFYVASAAFRAFRVKSITAALMCITAIIVMFGKVPLGEYLWGLTGMQDTFTVTQAQEWLLNNPSMAARRAVLFGVTLGAIATSLKIIFGIERSYLGKD